MTGAALSAEAFAALMRPCGPFPDRPRIACALSGGPDSLALLLCLRAWTAARDGQLIALTVDHGLRAGSAGEAARMAALCAGLGVEHRILVWHGGKPAGAVQRAAREARYRLLRETCRAEGIAHLVLAHHRDDQAETVVLRLLAGSGPFGLAAMPLAAERDGLRLLRPLLPVDKQRLVATVAAAGLCAEDDPSNRDPRHRRVAVRRQRDRLDRVGLTTARLGDVAATFGRLRRLWDEEVGRLVAELVFVSPAGWAGIDRPKFAALPAQAQAILLSHLLHAIGGRRYPPAMEAVAGLVRHLADGRDDPRPVPVRSAGGCLLGGGGGRLLVAAEDRRQPDQPLEAGRSLLWRGRFAVTDRRDGPPADLPLVLRSLRPSDWRWLSAEGRRSVPPLARHALPAVYDLDGLWAVPHLNLWRDASAAGCIDLVFRPRQPLRPVPFTPVR